MNFKTRGVYPEKTHQGNAAQGLRKRQFTGVEEFAGEEVEEVSWVNELIDLYEINSDKVGIIEYRGDMPLCSSATVPI